MYNEGYSLSDIAAATGNNNNGNGMFGNDGWWIILLFLVFGAWGGNRGFGGFGGSNGGGAADGYVLASDFANISRQIDSSAATQERKLDSISNGICDSTFALNNSINGGFSAVQNALCQGFNGINQGLSSGLAAVNQNIMTNGYETRLGVNNIGYQLSNCCCDIEKAIADCCCTTQRSIDGVNNAIQGVNYNMAMNTNVIQQTMCNNTRDLLENQNANARAILDSLTNAKIEAKNERIAELQNENSALRLSASQYKQNSYLVDQLAPKCPVPAFLTCNPYTGQSFTNGYGYNCGNTCGCGC